VVWTQDLILARQSLFYFSNAPSLVLNFFYCFYLSYAQSTESPPLKGKCSSDFYYCVLVLFVFKWMHYFSSSFYIHHEVHDIHESCHIYQFFFILSQSVVLSFDAHLIYPFLISLLFLLFFFLSYDPQILSSLFQELSLTILIGLLMTNSLNFPLSENVFIFPFIPEV
jgi:hypothetical protein